MNQKVDQFIVESGNWHLALDKLREIINNYPLKEDFKWGCPCYTLNGKNVVLLHGFKDYCAILFFKGALIQDDLNIMIQQTENVQSSRQIRFTSLEQILKLQSDLNYYINQAIEVEKSGVKVELKKKEELVFAEELVVRLKEIPELNKSFKALTPGRQRAYNLYFTSAKNPQTRVDRVTRCIPQILSGKGFTDCTCGLSKSKPSCDGSHKQIGRTTNLL